MSNILEIVEKAPYLFLTLYPCAIVFLAYLFIRLFESRSAGIAKVKELFSLKRHINNPIINPSQNRDWEAVGTFNPAAIKDDEGFVHLLYRAIGNDGLSRIGHAKSGDGMKFDKRSAYPVFVSTSSRVSIQEADPRKPRSYNTQIYTSGGGWGGCEDPRAVVIDGRVYMTYTAFEGWDSVRISLTSISLEDFKKSKWNWKNPKFISPPGEVHKNWVLFPEKINGKFAILHGVFPKIRIDYLDDRFNGDERYIKSAPPSGGREDYWDNWVRGAGPPPIKTDLGWLLLYHAMDKNDPNKYKLGCMILDLNDPTRELYRAPAPILEPDMSYENDWKPGVVYASGALVIGKDLVVYYGGGDKYVCVAKTPLKPLLDWLVVNGKI
jgi:predicted GH43/DUF377 family glycosyl hydrolase